ncbi:MAG: hypothetical protein JWR24_5090 [Actinoallomurus sp.]|nr:hypothetical protein [Actinoallomurus sp.]
MCEDTGELDGGPIDLSGVSLRDLAGVDRTVLDRELARLLERGDSGEGSAGFTNRV